MTLVLMLRHPIVVSSVVVKFTMRPTVANPQLHRPILWSLRGPSVDPNIPRDPDKVNRANQKLYLDSPCIPAAVPRDRSVSEPNSLFLLLDNMLRHTKRV